MILWSLILIPLLAAPLAWWIHGKMRHAPRWIAMAALGLDLALALFIWEQYPMAGEGQWLIETQAPWIPRWGISLHLGLDGLSLVLVLLTAFLGLVAVISSWTEIQSRAGFFHCNVLIVLSGVVGVFLALDLFLFFLFWELMLVPMYLLIALWGHENRRYASFKFFLFTQAGSLVLLVAMVGLALVHERQTGTLSFDYPELLGLAIEPRTAWWLMLGFFVGFAVKLPVVPFHTWLPDAHTEAPTGGSVLLAGLLLKTGAYGLLRFTIPLFPDAAKEFAPIAVAVAAVGIVYGGVLAFAQTDFKRLIAYSSVSHMGFALLGMFAMTGLAFQGAVLQLVAHGISTGALFLLAGALQERCHTRDMRRIGGLWASIPRLSACVMFFAVASLGLPGLANFVGEFLVLFGAYLRFPYVSVFATLGLVIAALYSLALLQRIFFGPAKQEGMGPDLSRAAFTTLLMMAAIQLWLGWYPGAVLSKTETAGKLLIPSRASESHDTAPRGQTLSSIPAVVPERP